MNNSIKSDKLSIVKEKYNEILDTLHNHPSHCEVCAISIVNEEVFNCDFAFGLIRELYKCKEIIERVKNE